VDKSPQRVLVPTWCRWRSSIGDHFPGRTVGHARHLPSTPQVEDTSNIVEFMSVLIQPVYRNPWGTRCGTPRLPSKAPVLFVTLSLFEEPHLSLSWGSSVDPQKVHLELLQHILSG
jgi:hypothetical protein